MCVSVPTKVKLSSLRIYIDIYSPFFYVHLMLALSIQYQRGLGHQHRSQFPKVVEVKIELTVR